MAFDKRVLMENEHIVARAKKSNMFLMPPFFWIIVAIVLFVGWDSWFDDDLSRPYVVGAFAVVWAFGFINRLLHNICTELVLTDKRVIKQYGVLRRSVEDVRLLKCGGAVFDQTWLGRLFNYGTVSVLGNGFNLGVSFIEDPLEFSNAVRNQLEVSRSIFERAQQSRENI